MGARRVVGIARAILSLPPREVLRRSARVLRHAAHGVRQRLEDRVERARPGGSGATEGAALHADAVLPVLWPADVPELDAAAREDLLRSARAALEHRFDLLGSGPVRIDYDLRAAGLGGYRYDMAPGAAAAEAQRRRMRRLLPLPLDGYDPVDWHVDSRSGFRWDPGQWFLAVRYGHRPGVDVKVPWELSRFQHAGALALAARLAPESPEGAAAAQEMVRQVVDWIAANPPRRGVNWAMPMDVALRAVSWLVATALLRDRLAAVPGFEPLLRESLLRHGRHIERNLEYHPTATGNHYLANLLGLLALGAALPDAAESDRWVVFALQELESEIRHQVLPDGVDVEGSTAYHAFVGEMFAVAAAIAVRIPDERRRRLRSAAVGRMAHPLAPPIRSAERQAFDLDRPWVFSPEFLDRLRKMAVFAAEVTKPDGHIPQIGDHDSGRVLQLGPPPDPRDWRALPALVGRLFGDAALEEAGRPWELQARLLVPARGVLAGGLPSGGASPVIRRTGDGSALTVFPAGGVAVARAEGLFLAIHAGTLSPRSPGGHFHNDVLSFELQWDGEDIVVDPGCYVYTPLPEARNAYRATAAHNTIAVAGVEQRKWFQGGLFAIERDVDAVALEKLRADAMRATCAYGAVRHAREWRWGERRLEVTDTVEAPAEATATLNLAPGVAPQGDPRPAAGRFGAGWELDLQTPCGRLRLVWEGVARPAVGPGLYSVGYGAPRDCLRVSATLEGSRARLVLERAR